MYNYNAIAIAAKWEYSNQSATGSVDSADDSFKNFLNSSMGSIAGGLDQLFGDLADRFPGLMMKEGAPGAGADGTAAFFGKDAGDYAAIGSDVLNSIFGGNNDLFKKVEDAISDFLKGTDGIKPMEGAYMQRSVTITVATVRFNMSQYSEGNGELLKADELLADFQDRLKELLEQFWGVDTDDEEVKEAEDAEVVDEADETGKTEESEEDPKAAATEKEEEYSKPTTTSLSTRNFAWSMQLFYSNSFISSLGNGNSGKASQSGFNFQAAGSFQSFSSSILPQSIYDSVLGGQNSGQSSLLAMMDKMLAGTGMGFGGLRKTDNGFMAELKDTKNMLAELFESLMNRGSIPAIGSSDKTESTAAPDATATTTAAESAAATTAAAAV